MSSVERKTIGKPQNDNSYILNSNTNYVFEGMHITLEDIKNAFRQASNSGYTSNWIGSGVYMEGSYIPYGGIYNEGSHYHDAYNKSDQKIYTRKKGKVIGNHQ